MTFKNHSNILIIKVSSRRVALEKTKEGHKGNPLTPVIYPENMQEYIERNQKGCCQYPGK